MVANEEIMTTGPQPAEEGAPPPEIRGGIRTTEFWLAAAMLMLSAYLASKGKDDLAAMLAMIATGVYTGFRTLVKTQALKKAVPVLLVCFFMAGCRGIDPDAIEGLVEDVGRRHNGYVRDDSGLSPAQKLSYQVTPELLLQIVDEAQGEPREARLDSEGRPR